MFLIVDTDGDRAISYSELKALVVGIRFEEIDLNSNDAVDKLMRDFDTSRDNFIDETEFVNCISRWLKKATRMQTASGDSRSTLKFLNAFHKVIKLSCIVFDPDFHIKQDA